MPRCHRDVCDQTHGYVWRDSFVCVAWLIRVRDMARSCVWQGSFVCVTWLIRVCDMTHSSVWHAWEDSCTLDVTRSDVWAWIMNMCDMTYSCAWWDSFVCVAWLTWCMSRDLCVCVAWIRESNATYCNTLQHTATHCYTLLRTATHCNALQNTATHYKTQQHTATWLRDSNAHIANMTRSDVWARLMNIYDMTLTYVSHDSFICVAWLIRACIRVCDVTDPYVCHDSSIHAKYIRPYTHTYIHTYTHTHELTDGGRVREVG